MDQHRPSTLSRGELDNSLYLDMLERIRSQAAALCLDAREICDVDRAGTVRDMTKWQQMQYRREMLLVTARLMQVMGWALSEQTSVRKGKTTSSARRWKLDMSLAEATENRTSKMYPHFSALVEDSLGLYQRVLRLVEATPNLGRPEQAGEPALTVVGGGEPTNTGRGGVDLQDEVLQPRLD